MNLYFVLPAFTFKPFSVVSNTVYMFLFKVYSHSLNYDHLNYEQLKL